MKIGEFILKEEPIVLNEGRETVTLEVTNTEDRAVQVGSHFHFFEVNKRMKFDRDKAYGFRLDIPSGTAVRFEPGETHEVTLVKIGGRKIAYGFNGLCNGLICDDNKAEALRRAKNEGFLVKGETK